MQFAIHSALTWRGYITATAFNIATSSFASFYVNLVRLAVRTTSVTIAVL